MGVFSIENGEFLNVRSTTVFIKIIVQHMFIIYEIKMLNRLDWKTDKVEKLASRVLSISINKKRRTAFTGVAFLPFKQIR